MSRRYYCEFCEKQFADNPTNRRNHQKGVHHQRMKKAHYDSFRDAAAILAEEGTKQPCRRFLQTGDCQFGPNCRFSHLTPEHKQELEWQALSNKKGSKRNLSVDYNPNLEEWLAKRVKSNGDDPKDNKSQGHKSSQDVGPEYTLPPSLMGIRNLPPSLLPPPPRYLDNYVMGDWG